MKVRIALSVIPMMLLLSLSAHSYQGSREISSEEDRQLREFAVRLFMRLEETRDFRPLLKEFFLEDFAGCAIENRDVNGDDGKPLGVYLALNLTRINRKLAGKVPADLLQRLFVLILNNFYLSFYLPPEDEADDEYKIIIREINDYIQDHPELPDTYKFSRIKQIRDTIQFLEKRETLTRDYINRHIESSKQRYEKRFTSNSSLAESIHTEGAEALERLEIVEKFCNLPKGEYYSMQVSNYYILELVRVDGKIKVIRIFPDPS